MHKIITSQSRISKSNFSMLNCFWSSIFSSANSTRMNSFSSFKHFRISAWIRSQIDDFLLKRFIDFLNLLKRKKDCQELSLISSNLFLAFFKSSFWSVNSACSRSISFFRLLSQKIASDNCKLSSRFDFSWPYNSFA